MSKIFILYVFILLSDSLCSTIYAEDERSYYKITGFSCDNDGNISIVSIKLITPLKENLRPMQILLTPDIVANVGSNPIVKVHENTIVYDFKLVMREHLIERPFIENNAPKWRLPKIDSEFIPINQDQKFVPVIISSMHVVGFGIGSVEGDSFIDNWFKKNAKCPNANVPNAKVPRPYLQD